MKLGRTLIVYSVLGGSVGAHLDGHDPISVPIHAAFVAAGAMLIDWLLNGRRRPTEETPCSG